MHDSTLTSALFEQLGALATPEGRQSAASSLARLLGGEEMLFFAADPELGVVLPAPGLPQVLPEAGAWGRFLEECSRNGEHSGTLTDREGRSVAARGRALQDGTAVVLVGRGSEVGDPAPILPLLPLLGALFRSERQVAIGAVRERAAADSAERASVLTRALQEMRQRLADALALADQARDEAQRRAEEAEQLAAELQMQGDQLQEQTVELELLNDELAARTEEAERARAAADEANRAKSQFLANMSHELRTPINAVIGYADLLNLGITGPVTEAQQAQLERIRVSSAHLLGLVNDVLDLAKVEAGHMTVQHEPERVLAAVEEATDFIAFQAGERGISLRNRCRDPLSQYVGDRDRVRQILLNLLSNAVKFTRPGGVVTVRCGKADRPPESAELAGGGPWTFIEVQDTGIGIAGDELPGIFRPFVQAESGHTRKHGGTGLGLTISRQLARLMGGDLTVRSKPGEGSHFTLWLPAMSSATGALDTTIRVGASSAADSCPPGLEDVGAMLQQRLPAIMATFVRRARAELPPDAVEGMEDGEVVGRLPVFLAEVACSLRRIGCASDGDPVLIEGSPVQRLIAEEHGADRGRRGWSACAARRELEILREEVLGVVDTSALEEPGLDRAGVSAVLERLMEVARRAVLRSLAATEVASRMNGVPAGPSHRGVE